MLRIRAFEETALAAAREGLVKGAIHPCIGQEAVAVGICANPTRADYLFATQSRSRTHAGQGRGPGGEGPAARAESLGIPAEAVDGNDVVAVDA